MSTRRFASLATDLFSRQEGGDTTPTPHHDNPVVAFIIGLAIVLLASILNAAGLNLTKLDHVRCFRTTLRPLQYLLTGLDLFFLETRCKLVRYPRRNAGRIGYDRYGYSE